MSERSSFPALAVGLDYPVFIVTAAHGAERSGCLVGFATQCSIHPGRFLVCISEKNHTLGVARRSPGLAVHVVDTAVVHLARLFGERTGDAVDKFDRCRWRDGPLGLPILEECGSWFAGPVVARHALGDHVGFVVEPAETRHRPAPQVGFAALRRLHPGHAP